LQHRIAICVGLTALAVAGATSAQAQAVYVEPPRGYVAAPPPMVHGGLPPNEILMVVRASGLRPLTQPARQGPQQYVLLASDNMGGQLRVVVNAHNGRIVHAAPAHDPRFAYQPARPRGFIPMPAPQHGTVAPPPSYGAAPPPDVRDPTPPLPRTARATPPAPQARAPQNPSPKSSSLASAPDVTGAVPSRPARTPLPRPRPVVAASEAAAQAPPAPVRQAVPETSPEAEASPAVKPAPAAPSAAPAQPAATETQMVPVAPLD
jgi:hypothetical protein